MVEFFDEREDGGVYSRVYAIERHGKGCSIRPYPSG
jgi:hypothetical protein